MALNLRSEWFVTLYPQMAITVSTELGSAVLTPGSPDAVVLVRGALAEQAQPQMREIVFESAAGRPGGFFSTSYPNALVGLSWDKNQDIYTQRARYLITEAGDFLVTEGGCRIRI
jgi:hypothetical protein